MVSSLLCGEDHRLWLVANARTKGIVRYLTYSRMVSEYH